MASPDRARIDYAPPGAKLARNVPIWPAVVGSFLTLVFVIVLTAQPTGFWFRARWISEKSLWYGVLSASVICVAFALVAAYVSRWHSAPRRNEWAASVVVIAVFSVWLASSIYPPHIHKGYNYVLCRANLSQLYMNIVLYSMEHGGSYPDTLEQLVMSDDHPDAQFLACPVCGDWPVSGDRAAVAAMLAQPGHVSYLYFGRGLNTKTVLPKTLIACDKPHNHDGPDYDCWALFADGSLQSIPRAQLERFIAAIPAAPATRATQPAKQ